MRKTACLMLIYFLCILFFMIGFTLYHNNLLPTLAPNENVIGISSIKDVDITREKIFDIIADVESYPTVLPNNFIYVKIINQTESKGNSVKIIFAEEKISKDGIITTLIVKHNIIPFHSHIIEIMDGDAKGTIIEQKFEENGNNTKLSIEAKIHLQGILAPFGFLTRDNLTATLDNTLNRFIEYARLDHNLQ